MPRQKRLVSFLMGGLYHSTSISSFHSIQKAGAILPNTGAFPESHGQSAYSCCRKIQAISLLDLRNPRPELLEDPLVLGKWSYFLSNHKPVTVIIEVIPEVLILPIRDYDSLKDKYPDTVIVPESEVCYPGPIPLAAICRLILVGSGEYRTIEGNSLSEAQADEATAYFNAKLQKHTRPESPLGFFSLGQKVDITEEPATRSPTPPI